MATMSISLPDETWAFVHEHAAREGYASASAYLRALVRDDQRRHAKLALEAKLREGFESGPATEMTREDWESIEREALEGLRGEVDRPHGRSGG